MSVISGDKIVRILLVSNNAKLIQQTTSMCNQLHDKIEVKTATTMKDGFAAIIENGFDVTIFDANINEGSVIKTKDLIEMNHFVNKNMLIICNDSTKKHLQRLIDKSDVSISTTLIDQNYNEKELLNLLKSSFHLPKRDSRKMLRHLMAEINQQEKSIFAKYKFLSFV